MSFSVFGHEVLADELSALSPILAQCRREGIRLPLWVEVHSEALLPAFLEGLEALCPGGGLLLSAAGLPVMATPRTPPENFRQYLGQEFERVIVDVRQGLNANALAASQGWVRGGGVWCVLMPDMMCWRPESDRDLERLLAWPSRPDSGNGLFLQRFRTQVAQSPFPVLVLSEKGVSWRVTPEAPARLPVVMRDTAVTQSEAIETLVRLMSQRARRPLVLMADRGRGKSAAMGIAAARILTSRPEARILVTAPDKLAVQNLLRHFEQQSGMPTHPHLTFMTPDALLRDLPDADLLLIDEAAAMPAPVVLQLVRHYRRVALATTTCGYEGSGQGFRLRVEPGIRAICPQLRTLELAYPMRWSAGDPLEAWCNRLFLQQTPLPDVQVSGDTLLTFRAIPASELDADERLLEHCFTLLREAHYRTTPDDLKVLLDAPSGRLFAAFSGDEVVGLAWFVLEGALGDPELIQAITEGRRRPRGHVLPQLLTQISVDKAPLKHLWARIMRIAVNPRCQNMGVGSLLLHKLVQHLNAEYPGLAGAGAVFAGDERVLRFWHRQHFDAFYLGTRQDTWTASHAVGVIRCFQSFGCATQAQRALEATLQTYGPTALAHAAPGLLDELLCSLSRDPSPWPDSPPRQLLAYAHGQRPLDQVLPQLREWLILQVETGTWRRLDPEFRRWTVARVLQQRNWADLCRLFDHGHPSAAENAWRKALLAYLEAA